MKHQRLALAGLLLLTGLTLGACGANREDAPATEETQMQHAPVQSAPADSTAETPDAE